MIGSEDDAAARMDGIYRHQRFIYDLTRRYYLLGRDRLIAELAPPPGGTVLEIGCGTGRNLVQAARLYPTAGCHGLDVSDVMLRTARTNIARAGLGNRITLAAGDARLFEPAALFDLASFDRVFVSYVLSMVPRWPDVVENALRCLGPTGSLHIVDFGDFARCPVPFSAAMRAWLQRFHVTPIHQFERQLATIATAHGLDFDFASPYRGYTAFAVLKRPAGPQPAAIRRGPGRAADRVSWRRHRTVIGPSCVPAGSANAIGVVSAGPPDWPFAENHVALIFASSGQRTDLSTGAPYPKRASIWMRSGAAMPRR